MKNERFFFERGDFGPGPRACRTDVKLGPGPRARWGGREFGGPPFGPGGPGGPRRRRRGDVRLALLMLLSLEHPLNGYQLMQRLEERSDGRWRPSPGSVYPALQQLEDEALIHSVPSEGESGRSFELSDAGRAHLEERSEQKAPWESGEDEDGSPRQRFRHSIHGMMRAVMHVAQDGTPEQVEEALKVLEESRKKLYRLLAGEE
ncbi:MAG TPA: PadR family transcriptional regulator [Solirubrobacteraceae bacterium]|nr:PadR family transcriptional regulator [Solirubrobacteraceae bacterium]